MDKQIHTGFLSGTVAMLSRCPDETFQRRHSRRGVLFVCALISTALNFIGVRKFLLQLDEEMRQNAVVTAVDAANRRFGTVVSRRLGLCRLASWENFCLERPLWMLAQCFGECEEEMPTSRLKRRTLLEGIINNTACGDLLVLAERAAVPGDGYSGNAFPFSWREQFAGISPTAAARWAIAQPEPQRAEALRLARAFVEATKKVHSAVQHFFDTAEAQPQRMEMDYVQLNCRRALSDIHLDEYQAQPTHVHADNCKVQGGSCQREAPWFWWRTYSAQLFLGVAAEDIGGNFFYSAEPQQKHVVPIFPACGRVATYEAGAANLHNNQQLRHGSMCQLSVFLTSDQKRAQQRSELLIAEALIEGHRIEPAVTADQDWEHVTDQYYSQCRAIAQGVSCEQEDCGVDTNRSWPEPFVYMRSEPERVAPTQLDIDGRTMSLARLLQDPEITLIDNFLSAEEMAHLIKLGQPKMTESTVWEKGVLVTAKYRNSKTGWLGRDPSDKILNSINKRIEHVTGLSLESDEEMQIASYAGGDLGKYEPHMDWGVSGKVHRDHTYGEGSSKKDAGARLATFLMYLNDVSVGGHTYFPHLNLSVAPRAGMAIFWFNLLSSRLGDNRMRHGACPVLSHEKLIATKWIHEAGNERVFDHEDWSKIATVDGVDALVGGAGGVPLNRRATLGRSSGSGYSNQIGNKNGTAEVCSTQSSI